MSSKKRKKKRKRKGKSKSGSGLAKPSAPGPVGWLAPDGIHALVPGSQPSPAMLEEITRQYQERIRNSPLWDEMIKQFGREKAEQLLKEFRAELR